MVGTDSPSPSGCNWDRERGAGAWGVQEWSTGSAPGMRKVLIKELTQTLVFLKIGRNLLVEEEKNISGKGNSICKAWRRVNRGCGTIFIQPISVDHAEI